MGGPQPTAELLWVGQRVVSQAGSYFSTDDGMSELFVIPVKYECVRKKNMVSAYRAEEVW